MLPESPAAEKSSDLADEVQRGSKGLFTLFPFGRADFAGVAGPILRRLDLAKQFGRVAADAFRGDLDKLDHAFGIEHEGAAVGQANAFAQDAELVRQVVILVTQHV